MRVLCSKRTFSTIKFTLDHEWVRFETEKRDVTLGITDYAQQQLGDVVYADIQPIGLKLKKGDALAAVESVKAASDVYAPCECEIIAINDRLDAAPQLVNEHPEDEGWFVKIRLSAQSDTTEIFAELMTREEYRKYVGEKQ